MGRPAPQVDPKELDAFLASAPESLKAWAEAQREEAEPGVDELEDDDIGFDDTPAPAKQPAQPLASRVGRFGTRTDGSRSSVRPGRPWCGLGPLAAGATTITSCPASNRLPSNCCTAKIKPLLPGP